MTSAGDYFGGAPKFSSANTFLGQKVTAATLATDSRAAELAAVEDVLGSSSESRYAAVSERLRDSSALVKADAGDFDVQQHNTMRVSEKLQGLVAGAPSVRLNLKAAETALKGVGKMPPKSQGIPQTTGKAPAGNGSKIANVANTFIGQNRYKYGGWDCSAFTRTVVKEATGVDITRSTATQMSWFKKQGAWTTDIKYANIGDVLYFRSSASASGRHTGIYIGNGLMIDNAGTGKPIKVRSIAGRSLIGIGLATRL